MKNVANARKIGEEQLEDVNGGSYTPGKFRNEALVFLKECLGETVFEKVVSKGDGMEHPYVAAKIFLRKADWNKYVWIEQHGSLDGYLS